LKCGADIRSDFRPFASRLHHAAGCIHPIFVLIGERTVIVRRNRAVIVGLSCRENTTGVSRRKRAAINN
jgi:hypothetical protein